MRSARKAPDPSAQAREFVQEFYRKRAEPPLFFLFRENLGVTNMQYAELLALLRVHGRWKATGERMSSPHFGSFISLDLSLTALFAALTEDTLDDFVEVYAPLFGSTIVLDRLYSSCAVYAPPGIEFDLKQVCIDAGYVHSCGRHIYTESLEDADPDVLTEAIDSYIDRSGRPGSKVFLAAYSKEDNPPDSAPAGGEGALTELRVSALRTYCGVKNIAQLLTSLKHDLDDVYVSAPGDYRKEREKFLTEPNADPTRTIWILRDFGSVNPPTSNGSPSYLVCYAQEWANANPVYLLDEEKPAWVAQNTMPHTLAAALTNITRPYWPVPADAQPQNVVLCDPFVGSGTVWLESLRLANDGTDLRVRCSDKNPLTPLMARDNLEFLTMPVADVDALVTVVSDAIALLDAGWSSGRDSSDPGEVELALQAAWNLLRHAAGSLPGEQEQLTDLELNQEHALLLEDQTYSARVLFYIGLRARVRNAALFRRLVEFGHHPGEAWERACRAEADRLRRRLQEFSDQRRQEPVGGTQCIVSYDGVYSRAVTVDYSVAAASSIGRAADCVAECDVRDLQASSVDIVITDPPYDFNEPEPGLVRLISDALLAILRGIRAEGHIVFCLPDYYSSRRQPIFAHKSLVVPQLTFAAAQEGFDIVLTPGHTVPHPEDIGGAPYYWRSGQLHRAIMHARVRRRVRESAPASVTGGATGSASITIMATDGDLTVRS